MDVNDFINDPAMYALDPADFDAMVAERFEAQAHARSVDLEECDADE